MWTYIIIALLVAFVAALILSPKFRQLLRIRIGDAADKATTPLEKMKDEYNQLLAKLNKQRSAVAKVMANANIAKKDLATAIGKVEQLQTEYADAKKMGASEDALNDLASKFAGAELAVTEQQKIVTESTAAAEEARKALEVTVKALQKFAQQVETAEGKSELAEAIRISAEAQTQAREIDSILSKAGQYSRDIDKELEEARAQAELSRGSKTEQELQELRDKAAAKAAREKLEKLGQK